MNGVSLWTATQGSGPPAVLCHGGPGIYDYLEPVAAMIHDLATVHRYDQRGCGRSQDEPPCDVATFVADLDALRAHGGYESWTVIGHSWGAFLAHSTLSSIPNESVVWCTSPARESTLPGIGSTAEIGRQSYLKTLVSVSVCSTGVDRPQ